MMIRSLFCGVLVLGVSGFAFTSSAGDGGKSVLAGVDTAQTRVTIRNIDHGEILWDDAYRLTTRQLVTPGRHVVTVVCEFHTAGGIRRLPGQVSLTFQPDTTYRLDARPSADGEGCGVSVHS